jgi:hypothetical protein
VSPAQGAVRSRSGEWHPLVVSLHFDRKRRSGSVRHALLSFARVRMNRHWMWGAVIEPVRRRRGAKKGWFRSCVSWLGGPGRETALWGRSCDAGPSTDPAHERPAAVPAVSTTSQPPAVSGMARERWAEEVKTFLTPAENPTVTTAKRGRSKPSRTRGISIGHPRRTDPDRNLQSCDQGVLDTCDGHQSHDRARYENRCCPLFNPEQAHELAQ